jgi:hypothetical protein
MNQHSRTSRRSGTRQDFPDAPARTAAVAGVGRLWHVDRHERTFEAFALRSGAWTPTAPGLWTD